MTTIAPTAWPADGARLLEPSISYALGVALAVTPDLLACPTPCGEWDLRMLLRHGCESLTAFVEGIDGGRVGLYPAAEDGAIAADPARAFRDRAGRLLDAWTGPGRQPCQVVEIAGRPLAAIVMAAAAALEIAVHGWDISRACGQRQPIPRALAVDLLALAPALVPWDGRHPLFAAPVTAAATAGPSDRLAAFLGRSPTECTGGPTGLPQRAEEVAQLRGQQFRLLMGDELTAPARCAS
jgi:uncharacterized protein (TIGR03086 family)